LEDKSAVLEEVLARYRDPLITAAFDLQSRIYNMCRQGFLYVYLLNGSDSQKMYAELHTLYVFAEYLGWVEIIRREIQFLNLQEIEQTKEVRGLLDGVATNLLSDNPALGRPFMLFRGEQRAIGEIVIRSIEDQDGHRHLQCMGYAEFTERMADPAFARWFAPYREQLAEAAADARVQSNRLVNIQNALVKLLEALDTQGLLDRHKMQRL
jgi:hypothetical protein